MSQIIDEIYKKAEEFTTKSSEEFFDDRGHDSLYDADEFEDYDHITAEEFAQQIKDGLSISELIDLAAKYDDVRLNDAHHIFSEGLLSSENKPIKEYLQEFAWCVAYEFASGMTQSDLENMTEDAEEEE